MTVLEIAQPELEGVAFHLPGVVLDRHGHRLLVDGRQRACSQRAMALLALLCQRPGRVWPRGELLDALWPGGQVVADESLSQLVFRLRAALGPRGECIVTVRGVGVRLDAPVQMLPGQESGIAPEATSVAPAPPVDAPADEPPTVLQAPVAVATAEPARTAPVGRRRPLWLLAAALLGLAGWLVWRQLASPLPPSHWLDVAMGVQVGDLGATPAATVALVAEAFEHERRGDRARARALMEAAHGSDPQTQLPALVLALWTSGIGDGSQARGWIEQATGRGTQSPYLLLLEAYVRAELAGRPTDIIRQAGALLDLRPQAWFMRLARAHLYGAMGLRDRALDELREIPPGDLRQPRLAMAAADRAAYGDIEGARALLEPYREPDDSPDLALARARIDWSAGDTVQARARLLATAQLARRHARLDIHDQALTYAGILDLLAGDPEAALSPLERARAGALDRRADTRALDLTLLLAHAHASLGRTEDLRMELDQAARLAKDLPSSDMGYFARLVALRLAPDLEPVDAAEPDDPGAASLIQARRALVEGDRARARALTARAVAQGTLEARLAEETRLLLAELGEPVPAGAPLQPPHPPLTRFVTRQWVDARMAAMSQKGHEVRGASGGPDAGH